MTNHKKMNFNRLDATVCTLRIMEICWIEQSKTLEELNLLINPFSPLCHNISYWKVLLLLWFKIFNFFWAFSRSFFKIFLSVLWKCNQADLKKFVAIIFCGLREIYKTHIWFWEVSFAYLNWWFVDVFLVIHLDLRSLNSNLHWFRVYKNNHMLLLFQTIILILYI